MATLTRRTFLQMAAAVFATPRSTLARRFADLPRHFIFEYYPWYGMSPVEHWNQDGRRPPVDLASNYMPRLGAYDSKSVKVLEQHATWMRETGAGSINVKSFRTIVPPTDTDCHGTTTNVADYADDELWRSQTDRLRRTFAGSFDHLTLLADSLNPIRTKASGFDGIAVYDNYVTPDTWRGHALRASSEDLLFSFNVNPGFDGIVKRNVEPGSCYQPPAIQPSPARPGITPSPEEQRRASERRIDATFGTTVALQTDAALSNARRGFFLVYINSFNEWHEGHQFEPMKNRGDLTREERAIGYRNPNDGRYRIKRITRRISEVG